MSSQLVRFAGNLGFLGPTTPGLLLPYASSCNDNAVVWPITNYWSALAASITTPVELNFCRADISIGLNIGGTTVSPDVTFLVSFYVTCDPLSPKNAVFSERIHFPSMTSNAFGMIQDHRKINLTLPKHSYFLVSVTPSVNLQGIPSTYWVTVTLY